MMATPPPRISCSVLIVWFITKFLIRVRKPEIAFCSSFLQHCAETVLS
jgi:hypothetical protein